MGCFNVNAELNNYEKYHLYTQKSNEETRLSILSIPVEWSFSNVSKFFIIFGLSKSNFFYTICCYFFYTRKMCRKKTRSTNKDISYCVLSRYFEFWAGTGTEPKPTGSVTPKHLKKWEPETNRDRIEIFSNYLNHNQNLFIFKWKISHFTIKVLFFIRLVIIVWDIMCALITSYYFY